MTYALTLSTVLLFSVSGCIQSAIDPEYCSDTVAGAPGCGPDGTYDEDAGDGVPPPTATLDTGVMVAEGGSAPLPITLTSVRNTVVKRSGVFLAYSATDQSWLLPDARVGDVVLVEGTAYPSGRGFSTNVHVNVATIATIELAQTDGSAVIELRDAAGNRLIDTTLSLDQETSPGVEQVEWDHLVIPTTPGEYRVGLTGRSFGQRTLDVTVTGQ